MKKIILAAVAAMMAFSFFSATAAAWEWKKFGAAPFAASREEAMADREKIFRAAGLSDWLVIKLVEVTSRSGSPAEIRNGDHLDWMVGGDGMHRDVVVAWPPAAKGVEFVARAEKWQIVWEGKTYTLLLPEVCYNWSQASVTPAPVLASAPPASVAPAVPAVFATKECPNGYSVVANGWSLAMLPQTLREDVLRLVAVARGRDSRNATNPEAYRGDALSRTLGRRLREEVGTRAPVSVGLRVRLRDPKKSESVQEAGILHIEAGQGEFRFSNDPRGWIVETIWPDTFMSPNISGGQRRLWLFPDEWGTWCSMNVHGLVP